MKTLLVLRHAKSSWKDQSLSDHDRPLNTRGKQDAPRMGALIRKADLVPDLIISSSAKRARKTAQAVSEAGGYEDEIVYTRNLYHAWADQFVSELSKISDDFDCVMVVGHNPGMEDLIEEISGEWVRMPTAALAQIELKINHWSDIALDGEGELANIWLPKEIR